MAIASGGATPLLREEDMSHQKIYAYKQAITEAERFITKARLAIHRLTNDEMADITGSKETAAAKRASMDLSRALSEIRRM